MKFFRGRSRGKNPARPETGGFDPFLGDVAIREAHGSLSDGDWEAADFLVQNRPDAWFVEDRLVNEVQPAPLAGFQEWADAKPSGQTLGLLAMAQVRDAWAIRGRAFAGDVDPDAWPRFHAALEDAEATIAAAATLDPDAVQPLVAGLASGRGLGLDKEELTGRFAAAHQRMPFHPSAVAQLLQSSCPKWGGSSEMLLTFARWVEDQAPPASAAHLAVPMAHLELAFAFDRQSWRDYLADRSVARELSLVGERILAAVPAETLPAQLEALNILMLALIPFDRRSAAVIRECVARIAGRPTELPWRYLNGSTPEVFKRFSARSLAEAANV